jgi:hypothetical protein
MAKVRKTKPREQLFRWRATLIKGTPAKYTGYVEAADEKTAIEEAAKEFKVSETLRDGIVATRDEL